MTKIDQYQISFHEATIIAITHIRGLIRLKLEDVLVNEAKKSMEVAIEGVETTERNGVVTTDIQMEKADAELLRLEKKNDHQILLVIEWKDYAAREQQIIVYDIIGFDLSIALRGFI